MDLSEKKRKIVEFLSDRKILLGPEFLEELTSSNDLTRISELVNQKIFDQNKIQEQDSGRVKILSSYQGIPRKMTAQDFITHFNSRYNLLKKVLQQRNKLENITSIGKLKGKQEREEAAVIGMVYSSEETKNGMMISVEDITGTVKVFFSKNKAEILVKAKDIVPDEVIGIIGTVGKGIIFANDVIFPEIPVTKELKKSPIEEYAVVISDTHVGSKKFLEDEFLRFISWLNGEIGNEKQKEVASKVKYLFIVGDSVDGISIYPTQKEELSMMTFREQYKKLAEYLDLIPKRIKIIISPGQHDIVPIAEPQIPIPKIYAKELHELPNIIFVSNPALVNIAATDDFPGFDVLLYHGASYSYYADDVESIRIQKPNISERAELVMKFLLQKRHLAPTYDGNPHIMTEQDLMFIDKIPDFFISGDVHKSAVFNYRGIITGIIGSCFQSRTTFQDKVGHVPDPGKVPLINLKTREVKILNFAGTE